jgi:DNA (cytosine-5)-methyltransferase 1
VDEVFSLLDGRGNLTLHFAKAIHAIRPAWVLAENVPGWLSTRDNAFGCFLAGLVGADAPLRPPNERGAWPRSGVVCGPVYGAAWRVLDAQYFGVPQRRRRVFVVGHLGDWRPAAQALFEREEAVSAE